MISKKYLSYMAAVVALLFIFVIPSFADHIDFRKMLQGANPEITRESMPGCNAGNAGKGKTGSASAKAKAILDRQEQEGDDAESVIEAEQDIMEIAFTLLEESQELWRQGDVEGAIGLLDQAYELLLRTDGDPDIARQKDDLRLLISKNILTIYTSIQTKTNGKYSEIPLVMNADVQREIRSFQNAERNFFISSYQRSAMYRPMIVEELRKAGLPEELSWLPLVESGYKINALSKARALGLWQFIPSTGYKYGMNRDEWIDERMDAEKSTAGAIAYMKDLHQMFGDWLTVLAAYNCGEGRVLRVISRQHINYLDNFWDLYRQLPNETARYVPRFLATLHIIKNPKKYGMNLNPLDTRESPFPYAVVSTNRTMRLSDIASRLDVSEEVLQVLNAELRFRMTPDRDYKLKVPMGVEERLIALMEEIPQCDKPEPPAPPVRQQKRIAKHTVKKGQTLHGIARQYGTSVTQLRKANRMTAKSVLRTGQVLVIPGGQAVASTRSKGKGVTAAGKNVQNYRVKKGDTLIMLARRFDMSVEELRRMNKISGSNLIAGTTIKVVQ